MSLAQDLLEEWRVWLLITALIGAGIAIGPHYQTVTEDDGSERMTIATSINKGLSIAGGARVLIEPDMSNVDPEREDAVIDNVITTLKTRVQAFGLQDMTIRPVTGLTGGQQYIRIEMAGANTTQLKELITRQGIFEAGFSMTVQDGDTITIGDTSFPVQTGNTSVTVDGQTINSSSPGILHPSDDMNVTVEYINSTGTTHRLRAIAFEGADITGVDINPTQSGVTCQSRNSCQFQFQVSVERAAAEKFQAIAQNFETGGTYLQGTQLVLTLDNSQVSALNVRNVFRNQVVETPTITGGGDSRGQAVQEMEELQSTLQSGALPVPISVVSTSSVSAKLGQQFMSVAIISILAAVIAVGLLIFLRYQNPRIALPIMLTGFSEVFILLAVFSKGAITAPTVIALAIPTAIGLAAGFKQGDIKALMLPLGTGFIIAIMQFAPSMDLAAIAGIIAAVGTGVDDQIIITDERSVKRSLSLKKRLKRAFFIIFTSAASTIGAMLPVMTIGAGAVRGFAITTILGVLIGISITRPAYATILDHVQ